MNPLEIYLQKRVAKLRSENLNDLQIFEQLKSVADSRKQLRQILQAAR